MDKMDRTLTVMVFNVDATNRHPDLITKKKKKSAEMLRNYLYSKIHEYTTAVINRESPESQPPLPTAAATVQGASNDSEVSGINEGIASLTIKKERGPTSGITGDLPDVNSPNGSPEGSASANSSPASIPADFNCLITVSEFNKTVARKLFQNCDENKKLTYIENTFQSGDYLAAYWNGDNWQREGNMKKSEEGKYIAVILKNTSISKRLLYVSVHLPNNDVDKKKEALKRVKQLLEDNEHPQEMKTYAVVIAGDFNMSPLEIVTEFGSDLTLAISPDDVGLLTTIGGNSIDNILISGAIELQSPITIDKDAKTKCHYSLYGVLRFKDE